MAPWGEDARLSRMALNSSRFLGMLSTAISQAASFLVSFIDGAETRMEEEAIAKIIRAANTSSVLVFVNRHPF